MENNSNFSSPSDEICEVCGESEMTAFTMEDPAFGFEQVAVCVGDCQESWTIMVNDSIETMPQDYESAGYYYDEDGGHQY